MEYTTGTIHEIQSGAEVGGIIHDQWIHFKTENTNLWLFDQNTICPLDLIGKKVKVKIGFLPMKIQKIISGREEFLNNRQIRGKVGEKRGDNWLLHVNEVTLLTSSLEELVIGQLVKAEGRLNLLEIKNYSGGWNNAK